MRLTLPLLLALLVARPALAGKPRTAPSNKSTEQGGTRFKCPLEKPQKVYGHALNASQFLENDETW